MDNLNTGRVPKDSDITARVSVDDEHVSPATGRDGTKLRPTTKTCRRLRGGRRDGFARRHAGIDQGSSSRVTSWSYTPPSEPQAIRMPASMARRTLRLWSGNIPATRSRMA